MERKPQPFVLTFFMFGIYILHNSFSIFPTFASSFLSLSVLLHLLFLLLESLGSCFFSRGPFLRAPSYEAPSFPHLCGVDEVQPQPIDGFPFKEVSAVSTDEVPMDE